MKSIILLALLATMLGCVKMADGSNPMQKDLGEQKYTRFYINGSYWHLFDVPSTNQQCIVYGGSSELVCWTKEKPAIKKKAVPVPEEEHKGW